MNKKKIAPWRIVIFILSIIFIVFLWARKDIVYIYSSAPKDQIAPLLITTIAVTLAKTCLIAGIGLFIRWIIIKIGNRKNKQ